MPKDYAKRPSKRRAPNKKKKSSGSWGWLLTGLSLGLVIAGVVYLKGKIPETLPKRAKAPQTHTQAKTPVTQAKPKFDFYSLLPEMEVDVTSTKTPVIERGSPSDTLDKAKYRLQLASFRRYDDADSLKAKLTLEGYVVEIESVTVKPGDTWYRVRTPVLSSQNEARKLQKKFEQHAIQSLLLKVSEG